MVAETHDNPEATAPQGGRACPICGKASVAAFRPFCSKRCADVDLHRWLGGAYSVPDEDAAPAASERDDDAC